VAEVDRAGKRAAGDAGHKIQRAIEDNGTCNASKPAGTTRDGLRFGKDEVRELQPQHFSCGAGKDLITVGRRPDDGAETVPDREWRLPSTASVAWRFPLNGSSEPAMAAVSATAPPFSAETDVGPVGVASEQAAAKIQKPTSTYRMSVALRRISVWKVRLTNECQVARGVRVHTPLGADEGRKRSCDKLSRKSSRRSVNQSRSWSRSAGRYHRHIDRTMRAAMDGIGWWSRLGHHAAAHLASGALILVLHDCGGHVDDDCNFDSCGGRKSDTRQHGLAAG
jgi:hypothetical protein